MSTPRSFRRLADLVESYSTIGEITQLLREMPDILYSNEVMKALYYVIPQIVKRNEICINIPFMKEVMNAEAKVIINHFQNYNIPSRGHPADMGCLLEFYVTQVVQKSGAKAIPPINDMGMIKPVFGSVYNPTVQENVEFSKEANTTALQIVGICFLFIHYTRWSIIDKELFKGLTEHESYALAFWKVFADISTPLVDTDKICKIVAHQTCQNPPPLITENAPDTFQETEYPFVKFIMNGSPARFVEEMTGKFLNLDDEKDDYISGIVNLIINYQNIITNNFSRYNYVCEYCSAVNDFMPLRELRNEIASRYERYFGDDAILYMADIFNAMYHVFGPLSSYQNSDSDRAMEVIHVKLERIIYDIILNHRDVDAKVIELFFDEVCKAHGYAFRGATEGCMLAVHAMIKEITKNTYEITVSKQPASSVMEAYLASADLLMAIEEGFDDLTGDYENPDYHYDDDYKKTPKKGDNNSPSMSLLRHKDAKLESKKSVRERFEKGKEAQKTIQDVMAMLKDAIKSGKRAFLCNKKKLTIFGLFRKVCRTVIIFSSGPFAILLALFTKYILKRASVSETRNYILELQEELELVEEKIKDAESEGDRQAKYALMRTRQAIKNQLNRVKFGETVGKNESMKRKNSNLGNFGG